MDTDICICPPLLRRAAARGDCRQRRILWRRRYQDRFHPSHGGTVCVSVCVREPKQVPTREWHLRSTTSTWSSARSSWCTQTQTNTQMHLTHAYTRIHYTQILLHLKHGSVGSCANAPHAMEELGVVARIETIAGETVVPGYSLVSGHVVVEATCSLAISCACPIWRRHIDGRRW